MIGFWSLLIGAVLLLLLLMVALKGLLTARELEEEADLSASDRAGMESCSAEFAAKIFSRDDWDFVSKMDCAPLKTLFRRERRAVALLWVRHTAAEIRGVMRAHAAAARRSTDLNSATELKLLLQYGQLMLICGVLFAMIEIAGPLSLQSLALYAQGLSQRIAEAQSAFQAATDARTMGVAGSS